MPRRTRGQRISFRWMLRHFGFSVCLPYYMLFTGGTMSLSTLQPIITAHTLASLSRGLNQRADVASQACG